MRCRPGIVGLLALLAVSVNGKPNYQKGQWIQGRATFYGGTDSLVEAYKDRGIESFGVIEHGSCGYTLSDGSLAYDKDMYAALADTNWDYPGSCGRCYEVRCKSGLVMDRGAPVSTTQFYYLATVNNQYKDTYGRSFPGNPEESKHLQYVKCWNDAATIMVKVGDSCPCMQKKPNGKVEPQFWCCGGANHIDLSYWAFEKLAHPVYGVMGIEYRPVDCRSRKPLNPVPGFLSNVIYRNDVGAGWGWRPYDSKNTQVQAKGEGLLDSYATCLTSSKNGAVVFAAREAYKPGFQPFAQADRLDFWVKSNTKSADPYASSTPPGQVPPLKVFLMNDEKSLWCGKEIILGTDVQPVAQRKDYYKFEIPLSLFKCDESSSVKSIANINRVDIMNVNLRDANYCLDDIVLVGRNQPALDPSKPISVTEQGKKVTIASSSTNKKQGNKKNKAAVGTGNKQTTRTGQAARKAQGAAAAVGPAATQQQQQPKKKAGAGKKAKANRKQQPGSAAAGQKRPQAPKGFGNLTTIGYITP